MILLLGDLLAQFGVPSITIAAGFVAWYLLKSLKLGRRIGSLIGSVILYGIVALVIIGVGSGLNWFDVNVGAFVGTIETVWNTVSGLAGRYGPDLWNLLKGGISG